jgi:hypothetical protein
MKFGVVVIVCDLHPHPATIRPAWVVCDHVLDCRVPIAYLSTPTKDDFGEMLCHDCREDLSLRTLRIECPDCVDQLLRSRELKP